MRERKGKYDSIQLKKTSLGTVCTLMYRGKHTESVNMEVARPNCHPSWHGLPKPEFIARFKYGYKPWKAWVNFLVKNVTVETVPCTV